MAPSMYGQCIARELFSDDELANNMLFPVRETGHKSLSPNRSNILKCASIMTNTQYRHQYRQSTNWVSTISADVGSVKIDFLIQIR